MNQDLFAQLQSAIAEDARLTPEQRDSLRNAVQQGKEDIGSKALGGFTVYQKADGTYDYTFPGHVIPAGAKIVSKWHYQVQNDCFVVIA